MTTFTTPTTPAGTRVRETLGRKRVGVLTGTTRLNPRTSCWQHLVDFDGRAAWCSFLVIIPKTAT